jgi:hypothetical protein
LMPGVLMLAAPLRFIGCAIKPHSTATLGVPELTAQSPNRDSKQHHDQT